MAAVASSESRPSTKPWTTSPTRWGRPWTTSPVSRWSIRSLPGWPHVGVVIPPRRVGPALPWISHSYTSLPCRISLRPWAGPSSISWHIPARRRVSGTGTGSGPNPAHSNPPASHSGRSWPATCWSRYRWETGHDRHGVSPGVTVATLLPLTNSSAAPGLDVWSPDHWNGRRLADTSELAAVELVTAFGHGRHTCPAEPFSLSVMTAALTALFAEFEMTPAWSGKASPVRTQIGGVARAADPCPVHYRLKRPDPRVLRRPQNGPRCVVWIDPG